jgi:cell division control protein 12
MLDLISTTEDIHYENYRQQQMETRKFGEPRVKKSDNPKFKEEEEALRKRFTEQVKSEESRFRQWEQHVRFVLIKKKLSVPHAPPPLQLIAERDRLNKDLEMAHSAIKSLEAELDNLQVGYGRGSGRR